MVITILSIDTVDGVATIEIEGVYDAIKIGFDPSRSGAASRPVKAGERYNGRRLTLVP